MQRTAILVVLVVLVLVACGDNPPPTQIVIVISPTPSENPSSPTVETPTPGVVAVSPTPAASSTPGPLAVASTSPGPQSTLQMSRPAQTDTPRPFGFPTDVIAPVPIAEQVFEHGRMFWIRDTRQIWVMQAAVDDSNRGDWFCYNDTFEDGEDEVDPTLIPPESMYQPRRGFGKLWRGRPAIRDGLGWALTPEFELTSNYRYLHGGSINDGQYVPGPGEHRLTTLYNESIAFYEGDVRGDCHGGTWRKAS